MSPTKEHLTQASVIIWQVVSDPQLTPERKMEVLNAIKQQAEAEYHSILRKLQKED